MWSLILQIITGVLGIWLAQKFVPGVEFTGSIQTLFLIGTILGLINFFIKPILKAITSPLRVLTFGLFGLVINMGLVWIAADVLFPKNLEIHGILPLFWTTLIIWGLGFFLPRWLPEK